MPQIDIKELIDVDDLQKYAEDVLMVDDEGNALELTYEEEDEILDALRREQIKVESVLQSLGGEMERKFTDFSKRRHLKELEFINALLQHDGRPYTYRADKKEYIFGNDDYHSKPIVNITRQKVNLAVARMRDIQFPIGGDYNFRILPHPNVETKMAQASPNPQEQQMAQDTLASEYEKSRRMQERIYSQLVQGRFGNKAREGMRDWVLLGTSIIKGPVVDIDRRKIYQMIEASDGSQVANLEFETIEYPNSFRVDPKYFYPDPDALVPEDLSEAFEIHPMSKSQLIALKDNPSFMKTQLDDALAHEPDGMSAIGMLNELSLLDSDARLDSRYMVKEYHGPIPKDVLFDLGYIEKEDLDDKLEEFFGEVWFVQGTPIRVSLSAIEGYDKTPYQMVFWEKDDASIFGHGMAWMMRDAQRVAKSGWQMLLDNAGLSAGPQMVVHKEQIKPADGKWEMAPMKLWYFTEYGQNVQNAFQFFNVPNNQEQIANVVEMAMQFGDLESESPMIAQNLVPQANNTASGQAMTLTIGNVTQRDKSQLWDDYITRPLIEGYYHYNMQYDDDPNIKGNFEIELAGATESVDAQLKAQEVERILALAGTNEEYQFHINPAEAFREIVAATRVGKRILRDEEEVQQMMQQAQEEAANQGPSPDEQRAQANLMREQTRQQELQMEQQYKQAEMQMKQQTAQMEYQREMADIEARMMEQQTKLEMEIMKMAADADKDYTKMAQETHLNELREATKLAVQEMKDRRQAEEIDIKRQMGTGI